MSELSPSPASPPPRRIRLPRNRWARRGVFALIGLLALWALGWLALPPLVRWQGETIASEQLGRPVRIGAVDFKPWTLELTLSDLRVGGAPGAAADLLRVKRIYLDGEMQSLLRLAPVVDAIQVEAPELRLTHLGEGRYDIDDILARLAARPQPPEPSEPARFALYNIELKDGRIDFDDRAVDRAHEVRGLRLTLPFVSNLPSQRQIKVQPQLAFTANGSAFDSSALALPFEESRQTGAVLRLAGLDLKPYLGYLPAGLPVRLRAATVDADLRLGFVQAPRPSLRLGGTLAVSGLKSVDAQDGEALAFDALKVELGDVRPLERQVQLASVELTGPRVAVRRRPDGQLNLLPQAPADAPESGAASAPSTGAGGQNDAESAAWRVAIDKLAVRGGAVDFTDETTAAGDVPAAAVRLHQVELAAATLAWPLAEGARAFSFSGSAALAGTEGLTPAIPDAAPPRGRGAGRARAPAAAAPPARAPSIEFQGQAGQDGAEVDARVAAVPLALAAPYAAPYLAPRLTGELDARVGLQWAPPKARDLPPELKVAAERLTLARLMLAEPQTAAARLARTARAGTDDARARAGGPLASADRVELAQVLMDWRTRAVSVGKLAVQAPRLTVAREADQRWMFEDWLRLPAEAPSPAKPQGADIPWKATIAELAVTGGHVGWRDAAVPGGPVEAELTQLHLGAKQIDLDSKQPMPVVLAARLGTRRGEPGRLSWRGSVGLAPLSAQGAVDAQRLPVHAFEPYFGQQLNIDILRAEASFKGSAAFTQTAQGPRLRVSGDASLEELRTHSRPGTAAASDDAAAQPAQAASAPGASQAPLAPTAAASAPGGLGEELLSWKLLRLAGLDVQVEPGQPAQVDVKDTLLSDFYARLLIHPNGRINLQDVVKSAAADTPAPAAAASARAAAGGMPAAGEFNEATNSGAAGAGPAGATARNDHNPDPMAPVIRVGPVRLANGKVYFSDRFVRPNYSADLSELNGTLGAFSSVAPAGAPQMAELQLTGRAEGTAQLAVNGKLNPLAKPLALDIQGKVTDLELPPLTPYSVRYAGHGIERGKLSMDVAYKIQPDGQLTASNRLVLNQLEFGEPVAGAPASLPVKLATALLSDSKGVIDLDLPISGSLNDPQFSLGPVIFKAIVNLIAKAITAPFTLLARALGGDGGQDMSHVAFAPGSARLDAKARAQLDQVAKALADRPQLRLTVVGTARLEAEREGYRRERLKALAAAERRGDAAPAPAGAASGASPAGAASGAAPAAAASAPEKVASGAQPAGAAAPSATDVTADADYPQLLRRLYRRADIPGRPRNAIGLLRDVPVPEMEALLMAHIEVGDDAMRQLAVQRGVAVKDYLAARKLPAERLFLGAARTGGAAAAQAPASAASAPQGAWSPRAELALAAR